MRNLTCWAISFDKQSMSGTCIMESDVASEQIHSQMQNYLFYHVSENTKEQSESNKGRPTALTTVKLIPVPQTEKSMWCLF